MLNLHCFVFLVAVASIINYVSTCTLSVLGISPLFTQTFGSRTIAFKAREDKVYFEDSVKAYCSNGELIVESQTNNYDSYYYPLQPGIYNTFEFHCFNNMIDINDVEHINVRVSCSNEIKLKLYESSAVLPKCGGFNNYAIGFNHVDLGEVIKAGICYDLDALSLKFAMYVASSKNVLISKKNHNSGVLPVSLDFDLKTNDLNNFFDLIKKDSLDSALANQFQVDNLIQDKSISIELQHWDTFNTIWWRQLREENWRYFLEALGQRTKSAQRSYVVSVGTYGNITMPSATNNCTSSKPNLLTVKTSDTEVLVPAYMWAYVKSLAADDKEEFVVIGHNSPYAEDPEHNPFCAVDMCDEIEWLKESKFGYLRRLPTLGYTFCCPPDEVANIIDYIPLHVTADGETTVKNTEGYYDVIRSNNN
ncbi:uncharacterized protein LOC105228069 isoform X2 [Bactrocera dorsalis]|uniref:Uncharacterized protein LOC105228069 isoform X2 n=1 Tax=Bactrocera dorsalis TaxID=27457 RepID=A0A6I9V3Q2_BACDO|nr:uncharacterized protein LOC105228069 isoform X2 [Bactrocera dorsalis]